MSDNKNIQYTDFMGLPILLLSFEEAVDYLEQAVRDGESVVHGDVNASKLVQAKDNENLSRYLQESNVLFADGVGVAWASRLLGKLIPGRVPGIELMETLIDRLVPDGFTFYFLGAREEIVVEVVNRVADRYGKQSIAGFHNGYFDWSESRRIAAAIGDSGANVLFVGMNTPRKERFIHECRALLAGVNLKMTVGGAFDVYSGAIARAPLWMRKAGLEWFYRFLKEPRRLSHRVLVEYPRFVLMVMGQVFRRLFTGNQRPRKDR